VVHQGQEVVHQGQGGDQEEDQTRSLQSAPLRPCRALRSRTRREESCATSFVSCDSCGVSVRELASS
jgi:hypothetical protein